MYRSNGGRSVSLKGGGGVSGTNRFKEAFTDEEKEKRGRKFFFLFSPCFFSPYWRNIYFARRVGKNRGRFGLREKSG